MNENSLEKDPNISLQNFIDKQFGTFIGKTIHSIRPLKSSELKDLYWERYYGDVPMAIIFTDGQVLIPSSDPEANGPGFLLTADLDS
jgi:hypothetical protein